MIFKLVQKRPERLFENRQPADTFKMSNPGTLACRARRVGLGHRQPAKRAEAGPAKHRELFGANLAKRTLAFAGRAADRTKSRKAKIQQIIQ